MAKPLCVLCASVVNINNNRRLTQYQAKKRLLPSGQVNYDYFLTTIREIRRHRDTEKLRHAPTRGVAKLLCVLCASVVSINNNRRLTQYQAKKRLLPSPHSPHSPHSRHSRHSRPSPALLLLIIPISSIIQL